MQRKLHAPCEWGEKPEAESQGLTYPYRTNAAISRTGLFRSLRAAYKALSGLRKEDNGRTAALRQKQDTLSSSIGKVTVLQTMWVL